MALFELIDGDVAHSLDASVEGGSVRIAAQALKDSLGWQLKPQGLCKGDICVPVSAPGRLESSDGIDLSALAEALGRPLALDVGERAAALGTGAADRAAQLSSLDAPDFELPDLAGQKHRLSSYRGKKVLLIAYASW
jgi:hypothetical protein